MRAKLGFGYSGHEPLARAMASKRQDIVLQRRKPTQARARATMETIFEATARIIERDGIAALNTNRIAERAGVGIGTLYEYFPNKEAILIAMARQRLAEDERLVRQALVAAEAEQECHWPERLFTRWWPCTATGPRFGARSWPCTWPTVLAASTPGRCRKSLNSSCSATGGC